MSFVGGMMPIERPQQLQYKSRSAYNSPIGSPVGSPYGSPAGSRRGSVSSITSARSEPGLDLIERLRQESLASNKSHSSSKSSKSGFRSLFSSKSSKPKEKKDYDKIVLTSRHAAAVKTKMMMDQRSNPKVKTAGIVGCSTSAHSSAAAQEARHPHSGPPAIHRSNTADLPMLTRIVSGDEQDDEDETARNVRLRSEWATSKRPSVCVVVEHESDESAQPSAETSADEDNEPYQSALAHIEKTSRAREVPRPTSVTRNSYGGRFHKDEKGAWRR